MCLLVLKNTWHQLRFFKKVSLWVGLRYRNIRHCPSRADMFSQPLNGVGTLAGTGQMNFSRHIFTRTGRTLWWMMVRVAQLSEHSSNITCLFLNYSLYSMAHGLWMFQGGMVSLLFVSIEDREVLFFKTRVAKGCQVKQSCGPDTTVQYWTSGHFILDRYGRNIYFRIYWDDWCKKNSFEDSPFWRWTDRLAPRFGGELTQGSQGQSRWCLIPVYSFAIIPFVYSKRSDLNVYRAMWGLMCKYEILLSQLTPQTYASLFPWCPVSMA